MSWIDESPEFSISGLFDSDIDNNDDEEMDTEEQTSNEPAEMQLRSRRIRLVLPVQTRTPGEDEGNGMDEDYQGADGDDDGDDDVPELERFCPYWRSRVTEVKDWYDTHGNMWPSATTADDFGYAYIREVSLANFLREMRRGARALQSGSTDEKALHGMTDDKLEYLDTRLPGWFEAEDHWTPEVERICEWRNKHGTLPRPLLKIIMSSNSTCVRLENMSEEEKKEVKLGQFLGLHRRLRSSFLRSRSQRFNTGSQLLQRLLILDEKLPNWYIVEDQWDELFIDLKRWKSENPGPIWPRVYKDITSKIMSGKELPIEIIRESRLGTFIERQKNGRFLRHGRKVHHGLTRRRERLLLMEVPGVFSARIAKVKVGHSRHPLLQKAIAIAAWKEANSGLLPRSVIYNDQGVATPDDELLEEQKVECGLGKELMELRAARNRAVYIRNRDGLGSELEDEIERILPGWRHADIQDA